MPLQYRKVITEFNQIIQTFTPEDNFLINSFSSRYLAFDNYINHQALTEKENSDGVTYIVLDEKTKAEKILVAYYTISAYTIHFKDEYDYSDETIPNEEKLIY